MYPSHNNEDDGSQTYAESASLLTHDTTNVVDSSPKKTINNKIALNEIDTQDQQQPGGHGSYGSFVAYCFCVNYILGVGVLGVPHAFYQGGVLFGPLFLFVVTVMAALVVLWLLETMSRAQALFDLANSDLAENDGQVGKMYIGSRKFEVNELCLMFLGRGGKVVYEICLFLYMYGGLWSYASVFAQSMASNVPIFMRYMGWYTCDVLHDGSKHCTYLYLIYIAVFAAIVVPLTCLDLTEQKPLQVLLTIFRYVSLALMIVVVFVSIHMDPYSRFTSNPHKSMERNPPYLSEFSLFNFSGLYVLMPVCIFSQILHHSTPGLSQPVKNKKHLPYIFGATFLTTYAFYTLLGVILAMYYGSNIMSAASLNFAHYRGGVPFGWTIPMWARLITLVVVLFPAVDVLSAFPLNGITLGNNIHTAFCYKYPSLLENRKMKVLFRLCASIPPLIGACIVRDLDTILQYVGLMGFIITFVFPPLLQIVSKYKAMRVFNESKTPYTKRILSHNITNAIVMLFGATAVILCLVLNVTYTIINKRKK